MQLANASDGIKSQVQAAQACYLAISCAEWHNSLTSCAQCFAKLVDFPDLGILA